MRRYAVDVQAGVLLRTWETRRERCVAVVLSFSATHSNESRQALAEALTCLSEGLWRAFARSGLDLGEGVARGRRRRLVDLLGRVDAVVRPSSAGTRATVQLEPMGRYVVGLADRVAAAMTSFDGAEVQEQIIREVEDETAAVDRADRGLFAGRSAQAELVSRAFVLPSHLREADVRFHERLFDDSLEGCPVALRGPEILAGLDLTAAAAAALHWFKAALDVLSEASGKSAEDAVMMADDYEGTSVAVLRSVVRSMDSGDLPQAVATRLVSDALHLTDTAAMSVRAIQQRVDDAIDESVSDVDLGMVNVRLAQLDPRRPAPALLELALQGMSACLAAYDSCVDLEVLPESVEDLDPSDEDERTAERHEAASKAFAEAVRNRAALDRARLL
jgi:hypothetical protein